MLLGIASQRPCVPKVFTCKEAFIKALEHCKRADMSIYA